MATRSRKSMELPRRLDRCARRVSQLATRPAAVEGKDRPVLAGVKPRRPAQGKPGVFGRALTPAPRGPETQLFSAADLPGSLAQPAGCDLQQPLPVSVSHTLLRDGG